MLTAATNGTTAAFSRHELLTGKKIEGTAYSGKLFDSFHECSEPETQMETRKRGRQAAARGSMDYCSGMSGLSGPSGALATTGLVDEVSEAEGAKRALIFFIHYSLLFNLPIIFFT